MAITARSSKFFVFFSEEICTLGEINAIVFHFIHKNGGFLVDNWLPSPKNLCDACLIVK
jgi:hypothetical protein